MYRYLIFDLDGTLFDSLEDIKNSLNEALNYYNFKACYQYEDVKKFIGSGAKILVQRALQKFEYSHNDYLNVYNKYNEIYNKNSLNNIKLYSNVLDTLNILKNKYILGILSNKPHKDVLNIINNKLPNIFNFIQGQVENVKIKPDKEAILNIANKYNINLNEVLYIGDMINDQDLAINSNIDFCFASYGYDTTNKINTYIFKIDSFKDLLNIL